MREAGIRWADSTGFTYSREDVDARALANYYAQHLGDMFTEGQKPLEVEILVAQLGSSLRPTKLYRVAYEGTISDEPRFAVLGGDAETIRDRFALVRRVARVARDDVEERRGARSPVRTACSAPKTLKSASSRTAVCGALSSA